MSNPETIGQRTLFARAALALLLLAVCALLGAFLGWLSAPKPQGARALPGADAPAGIDAQTAAAPVDGPLPPLFFYAGIPSEGETDVITTAEIGMAAGAGVAQVIVPLRLPWDHTDAEAAGAAVARVAAASPGSRVFLELRVDPTAEWLDRHPDDRRTTADGPQPHASVASALWAQEAGDRVAAVIGALGAGPHRERVGGVVLAGLGRARWISEGRDVSPAMREGFRAWLGKTYGDDTGLAAAWGVPKATLAAVEIPDAPAAEDGAGAFLTLPARQPEVDYRRYTDAATTAFVARLAQRARDAAWPGLLVYAACGDNIENPGPGSGQDALGLLLDSPLDGFITPFSYAERGLGGTGGPMASVHSARYRGKQWIFIDDTRTGIARDAITGAITRLEGLREEDVHSVLARNFAYALINGMGIAWADPQGEGTLHDERIWQRIAAMRAAYETVHPAAAPPPLHPPTLVVLYDEGANALLRDGAGLAGRALLATREAALRTGVPTHFALLDDFLADRVPPAPVYLFANTFAIDPARREAIHARLAREQASAVWFHAPGYFAPKADTANIAATVGMGVKAVREGGQLGSEFLFSGRWVEEGRALESAAPWAPIFHIDEPEADPLARYTGTDRVSIAMRFLPEGWTSIYIADPSLGAPVLREILGILERPMPVRPSHLRHFDAIFTGGDLIAIHGRQTGERTIDLGGFHDVVDLLDPDIGWPARDNFVLSLKTGETRVLRRTPAVGFPMPEPDPEDVPAEDDLAGDQPDDTPDPGDADGEASPAETVAP